NKIKKKRNWILSTSPTSVRMFSGSTRRLRSSTLTAARSVSSVLSKSRPSSPFQISIA
ncbi:unnamed protein product, partial [Brassica rapa subsp. narinosa]